MTFRILLVDKDDYLLEAHRRFFTKAGFHVDTVASQKDAIPMLLRNRYAAIVCDLQLSKIDGDRQGLELAAAARRLRPGAAFFLLTSDLSGEIARRARSSGVFLCISKPAPLTFLKDKLDFAIAPERFRHQAVA